MYCSDVEQSSVGCLREFIMKDLKAVCNMNLLFFTDVILFINSKEKIRNIKS